MVNVLSFRFLRCFGLFIMLLVQGSSEAGLYLITFFGARKFKNRSAIRLIFFLKLFKNESILVKCKKNLSKPFFSKIIPSEDVAKNCLY